MKRYYVSITASFDVRAAGKREARTIIHDYLADLEFNPKINLAGWSFDATNGPDVCLCDMESGEPKEGP